MTVLPLHTERLSLRPMRIDDLAAFVAYRNDPEVARYQDWPLPFITHDAERLLEAQSGLADITPGTWVQIALVDDVGTVVGDLAVGLSADGHVADVGYSLARDHWGVGYATEALSAMVDALFGRGVHRVVATLDPANVNSMRVLERTGFLREGVARRAVHVRGVWSDDLRFSLLADERAVWRDRLAPATLVELVELDADTVWPYARLVTHPSQESFVAPMSASFADALFPEVVDGAALRPWLRGIRADGDPAGFMMTALATAAHPDPYLWRLLIDRRHQGRGIGRAAVLHLAALLRTEGHRRLTVSWVDGRGGPSGFYQRLGFRPTGRLLDGEVEGELML